MNAEGAFLVVRWTTEFGPKAGVVSSSVGLHSVLNHQDRQGFSSDVVDGVAHMPIVLIATLHATHIVNPPI
jgi:hypothetical protein